MYKNLKTFRESLSMTQKDFAKALDLAPTTYSGYEQGVRDPHSDFWISVATKFGVSIDYLMGYSNDPRPTSLTLAYSPEEQDHLNRYRDLDEHGKKMVDLVMAEEKNRMLQPVQNAKPPIDLLEYLLPVSAGFGVFLGSDDVTTTYVTPNLYTEKADYILSVEGESMAPRYHNGDRLLIEETDSIDVGEIGIFVINGDGYVKKLADNYLKSLNRDYPDIHLSDLDEQRCVGRVIGVLDPSWIVNDRVDI